MKLSIRISILALLGITSGLVQTVAAAEPFRLYLMGNSLTDQLDYDRFTKMVESGGERITLGSQRVPGAPIGWLLNNPDGGFTMQPYGTISRAFAQYTWDALSLQPFQWDYAQNIRDIPQVLEKFYQKSPAGDVFIYAQWPASDKGGDWTRRWLEPRSTNIMSRQEYEDHVTWLRANNPGKKPARLVPVGHVMHLLDQRAKAGLIPGLNTMWEWYIDGVHVNNAVNFIVGSTFYAVAYGKSPVGLSYEMYNHADSRVIFTPKLAKLVQEAVWEVVASHPLTGVTSNEPVRVVTPRLEPAVVGSNYRQELQSAFGGGPGTWTISGTPLPEGLSLSPDGVLSGAAVQPAKINLTVAVAAPNKSKAQATLALQILPDTKPVISSEKLPAFTQGTNLSAALRADSENPPLVWSVTPGSALPVGLHLNEGGIIEGTPGFSGPYRVEVSVTDGDTQNPDTTVKIFEGTIAPAGRDVAFARMLDKAPDINGRIDGKPWDFTKYPLAKIIDGKARATAGIDFGWNKDAFYAAVKVADTTLADGQEGDSAVIFIDGKNNRETILNWDDWRTSGAPHGWEERWGGSYHHSSKIGIVEGGYLLEMSANLSALGHERATTDGPVGLALGLDAIVTDRDAAGGPVLGRRGWLGSASNWTDPSQYRTVILKPASPDFGIPILGIHCARAQNGHYSESTLRGYQPDLVVKGGSPSGRIAQFEGTEDHSLHHYWIEGEAFSYRLVVPDGNYRILFHFSTNTDKPVAVGDDIFDVTIDGKKVLTNFDIVAKGGGAGKAITQEVKHTHRGQEMLMEFAATKGRARIAAFHLSLIPED